jgi:ABC-2 type transport system permease protein
MNNSFLQLVLLQFRSFYREPAILFWAIGFPIIMAGVLGIAFNNKEVNRKVMILGGTDSVSFEKVLGADVGMPARFTFIYGNEKLADKGIKRGEILLYFLPSSDRITFFLDPTNAEALNTYLMLEREFRKDNQVTKKIVVEPLTSLGNRYIDLLIPGLIALGILNSCIWGISWTLINYRIKKLLRRMIATPMKKSYFFLAQFSSRIFITIAEAVLLFLFAWIFFKVQISGSLVALAIVFLSGVISFSGLSILVSCKTANTEVANGIINAVTLPMMILSGIFFSYNNFPDWLIPAIKILPLTMLADAFRSIFIEGAGIKDILFPSLILLFEGGLFYWLGRKFYEWS